MRIADHFYTLNEAAAELGVVRHTVWRWIKAGKLTAQKVGGVVLIEKNLVEHMITPPSEPTDGRR